MYKQFWNDLKLYFVGWALSNYWRLFKFSMISINRSKDRAYFWVWSECIHTYKLSESIRMQLKRVRWSGTFAAHIRTLFIMNSNTILWFLLLLSRCCCCCCRAATIAIIQFKSISNESHTHTPTHSHTQAHSKQETLSLVRTACNDLSCCRYRCCCRRRRRCCWLKWKTVIIMHKYTL